MIITIMITIMIIIAAAGDLRASGDEEYFNGEGGWSRGRPGGGRGAGGSSLQNLHAMVVGVSHDDAPVAVDGDAAIRVVELSVA